MTPPVRAALRAVPSWHSRQPSRKVFVAQFVAFLAFATLVPWQFVQVSVAAKVATVVLSTFRKSLAPLTWLALFSAYGVWQASHVTFGPWGAVRCAVWLPVAM